VATVAAIPEGYTYPESNTVAAGMQVDDQWLRPPGRQHPDGLTSLLAESDVR